MQGLSLVAASGGHSSSRCTRLSLSRPLLLRSTGSRRAGSVVVAHGLSCSAAYGIFPDQGSNPCPLHWQADSQPLRHQGSPPPSFLKVKNKREMCFQRNELAGIGRYLKHRLTLCHFRGWTGFCADCLLFIHSMSSSQVSFLSLKTQGCQQPTWGHV